VEPARSKAKIWSFSRDQAQSQSPRVREIEAWSRGRGKGARMSGDNRKSELAELKAQLGLLAGSR